MTAPRYVVLEKQVGQTPLEAIEEWRHEMRPLYADTPATYAGRLDPMASGKLIVLLGDECKKRDAYTGLDKEYEIEVALDLSTDTGDALGLADYAKIDTKPNADVLKAALSAQIGSRSVPYPAFSSKTVEGTPLFLHALRGTLGSIRIPEHVETIHRIKLLRSVRMSKDDLHARIGLHLSNVPLSDEPSKELGQDFRQHDIRARWEEVFGTMHERSFTLLTLRVTCASGTYMRTLASRIARSLETYGFALSIHRTKIGRFKQFGPFGFWPKTF